MPCTKVAHSLRLFSSSNSQAASDAIRTHPSQRIRNLLACKIEIRRRDIRTPCPAVCRNACFVYDLFLLFLKAILRLFLLRHPISHSFVLFLSEETRERNSSKDVVPMLVPSFPVPSSQLLWPEYRISFATLLPLCLFSLAASYISCTSSFT